MSASGQFWTTQQYQSSVKAAVVSKYFAAWARIVGNRCTEHNYKDAMRLLEARGEIVVEPSADKRPKRNGTVTFADKTKVTFPRNR